MSFWDYNSCCQPSRFAEFVNGKGSLQNVRKNCCQNASSQGVTYLCCPPPPPPQPRTEIVLIPSCPQQPKCPPRIHCPRPKPRCCPTPCNLEFDDSPGWPNNSPKCCYEYPYDDSSDSDSDDTLYFDKENIVRCHPKQKCKSRNVTIIQTQPPAPSQPSPPAPCPPQPQPISYPMPYPMMPPPFFNPYTACGPSGSFMNPCGGPFNPYAPPCGPFNPYAPCGPCGSGQPPVANSCLPFGMNLGAMGPFGAFGTGNVIPMCIPTCAQSEGPKRRKHRKDKRTEEASSTKSLSMSKSEGSSTQASSNSKSKKSSYSKSSSIDIFKKAESKKPVPISKNANVSKFKVNNDSYEEDRIKNDVTAYQESDMHLLEPYGEVLHEHEDNLITTSQNRESKLIRPF